MKHLVIGAALIALGGTAAAHPHPQPEPRGIEADYADWRPTAVDLKYGVASFVADRRRAGNAVLFRVFKVHRSLSRQIAASFDKELVELLGDCGSRTLLRTGYRMQTGNAPPPMLASPVQYPAVVRPDSAEHALLASACGESRDEPVVADPSAWAKARL
jgi:hypothetical protein